MDFEACFNTSSAILMEVALGERLKREYNIIFDDRVAMAGLIYNASSNKRQPYDVSKHHMAVFYNFISSYIPLQHLFRQ